jgi:hypothetical protein
VLRNLPHHFGTETNIPPLPLLLCVRTINALQQDCLKAPGHVIDLILADTYVNVTVHTDGIEG